MSFTVATARGSTAVEALRTTNAGLLDEGRVALVQHGDAAVAWSTTCLWVDVHDDDDVLVLVDGMFHGQIARRGRAAAIAERFRALGDRFATGLLGDFVVVVLDKNRRRMLEARDPLGVRPWYQSNSGRLHAAASDVASLVTLSWVNTQIHERTAIEYLANIWMSRGETLYAGVRTLAPGATWVSRMEGGDTFTHHRWNVEPDVAITWDDAAERCRSVLDEVVKDRLDGSFPATCELSGGLDSSAVVGTVVGLGKPDLLAGRLLFDGPTADEREYSAAVIDHWHVDSIGMPPWMPTPAEWDQLARQLRRPVPAPNFVMFEGLHGAMLAQGRPECLTGLGGDDAFVGMGNGSRIVSSFQLRQYRTLRQVAAWTVRNPRESWREALRPTLRRFFPNDGTPPWVRKEAAEEAGITELLRKRPRAISGIAAIDERFANVTSGYHASILEEAAAVHDVTGRRASHPFLDPRMITATYGLNPWWPTYGGHTRALEVAAFADRLPPLVSGRRTKAEFSEVFWPLRPDEAEASRLRDGILATAGWLDRTGFDALLRSAHAGDPGSAIPLARCVALDRWLTQTF